MMRQTGMTARLSVLLCGLGALTHAADATGTKTVRLGQIAISYDAERWQADASSADAVMMEPVGVLAGRRNPVRVSRVEDGGDDACERLARRELSDDMYGEPSRATIDVAGAKALQFTARARCRNAMPTGAVVCLRASESVVLFTDTRPSCRSGADNIFSDVDPFAELLDGVQIAK